MALDPTVQLVTPYPAPADTYRALTVSDMFTVAWSSAPFAISYNVGEEPTYSKRLKIRNDSVTNKLNVEIILPPWLTINTESVFTLDQDQVKLITFTNDEVANLSIARTRTYEDAMDVIINVTPINVTSPVYVRNIRSELIA
jgi:hypothetical protein